jgi:isoamylase
LTISQRVPALRSRAQTSRTPKCRDGVAHVQVGNFPVLWNEWNGKYGDTVRRFWKGDRDTLAEFATRFSGSSALYQNDGRKPSARINFITCHDGFTLYDLVNYNDKHHEGQRRKQSRWRQR